MDRISGIAVGVIAGAALMLTALPAMARVDVSVGIGLQGVAPAYQSAPMYQPTPIYVQPAPIYEPTPVYAPTPVYVQPAPVYVPQPVYVAPAPVYMHPAPVYLQPVYGYGWRRRY